MRKQFFLLYTAILLVSFVGIQSCQSTKSATTSKMLKFNLEKGKGYDYEMMMSMDQTINKQIMKMDVLTYYSMDVKDDNGETKIINSIFDRFKMNMDIMGMNMEIDTDKPFIGNKNDKNPLGMVNRLFRSIKGQQFAMKVNAEGKIEEVTGFDKIAESIADSMGLSAQERVSMLQEFSKQFNGESIKGQLERFLYIFPNKEVRLGDSWQKSTTTTGQMAGTYNSTYTVQEIEGDMVTLKEISTISSADGDIKLKGEGVGTLVVDSKTGLVVRADQQLNMTSSKDDKPFEMKVVSKIKGKAR